MSYVYKTRGTCSTMIEVELEGNVVKDVKFTGGCNGNLKAVGKLTQGMDARKVADILAGNTCGHKQTSCADQLARAIRAALTEKQSNLQEDSVS